MGKQITAVFFFIITFIACNTIYTPAKFTPTPIDAVSTSYCKPGCDHLKSLPGQDGKLGCLESRNLVYPHDAGVQTCEQYCVERMNEGRDMRAKCWVSVSKCEDIEKARITGCP